MWVCMLERNVDNEDICLWADGTWCYAEIVEEYLTFMSDDFERIKFDSARWHEVQSAE